MSPAITFTPRHAQPFTLEQAVLLEVDVLVAEVSRLENSLARLRETQLELSTHLKEDPEGDEDGELAKAMAENDETIESQRERVTLIKVALLNRVGEGGVRHMGLDLRKDELKGEGTGAQDGVVEEGGRGAEEEQGVHL